MKLERDVAKQLVSALEKDVTSLERRLMEKKDAFDVAKKEFERKNETYAEIRRNVDEDCRRRFSNGK